jgi:hypothetical protein
MIVVDGNRSFLIVKLRHDPEREGYLLLRPGRMQHSLAGLVDAYDMFKAGFPAFVHHVVLRLAPERLVWLERVSAEVGEVAPPKLKRCTIYASL